MLPDELDWEPLHPAAIIRLYSAAEIPKTDATMQTRRKTRTARARCSGRRLRRGIQEYWAISRRAEPQVPQGSIHPAHPNGYHFRRPLESNVNAERMPHGATVESHQVPVRRIGTHGVQGVDVKLPPPDQPVVGDCDASQGAEQCRVPNQPAAHMIIDNL